MGEMPRYVAWPLPRRQELVSPFRRGKNERPIRLTLHSEMLGDLPSDEQEYLDALLDLAGLPWVEAAQTCPSRFPQLAIDYDYQMHDELLAEVGQGEGSPYGYIQEKGELPQLAARLAGQEEVGHPEARAMYADLLIAQAHMAVRYDLLVTTSRRLLDRRDNHELLKANPVLPSEAVKLVGLFLRSRDEYRFRDDSDERPPLHLYRYSFYNILAREHLPNFWFFRDACAWSRRENTQQVAESILTRGMRALEARDALGMLFNTPDLDSIDDRVLYHFDYLSLLLFGAFDALARVAFRVYQLDQQGVAETRAGFHRADFRKALNRAGATDLHQLVSGSKTQGVLTILGKLRNNIHGEMTSGLFVGSLVNLNAALVVVPNDDAEVLWQAFTSLGAPERWGAQRRPALNPQPYPYKVQIEPYTFALVAVAECLSLGNEMMARTDVTKILPAGITAADLQTGPQPDDLYPPAIRRRIALLG